MNEPDGELMDALAELQQRYPAWRFGQIVANVARWVDQKIWDIENAQLLGVAVSHLHHLAKSEAGTNRVGR